MGTLPPDELLRLWKLEKLPVEMAIGQILQHLVEMYAATNNLHKLRTDVNRLMAARVAPRPTPKDKPKSPEETSKTD